MLNIPLSFADPVHNKSVMCYVEYGSNFKIEKVDLSLCTHLIAVDHIWGVKFETEEGMMSLK